MTRRLRVPARGERIEKTVQDLLYNYLNQLERVPEDLPMPEDATPAEQQIVNKLNELLSLLRDG